MNRRSDRYSKIARCEGMRDQREIEMGASGGGQPIRASGDVAARTGRTETRSRFDWLESNSLLTRGGRPHNPFKHVGQLSCGNRHRAVSRRRPYKPAALQPLGIERHADPVMPENLDQLTRLPRNT